MIIVVLDEVADDALAVAMGFSEIQLGFLFTVYYLAAAAGAKAAPWLERRTSVFGLAVFLVLFTGASLLITLWLGMATGALLILMRSISIAVLLHLEITVFSPLTDANNRATRSPCLNSCPTCRRSTSWAV
ncbi:MAG: hypothetical protein QNK37_07700 [Acidobacteriota bacterium]|nr:hypothetical protein [Acidobacteriota bacterium]